jgi:hypothetical protein
MLTTGSVVECFWISLRNIFNFLRGSFGGRSLRACVLPDELRLEWPVLLYIGGKGKKFRLSRSQYKMILMGVCLCMLLHRKIAEFQQILMRPGCLLSYMQGSF